MEIIEQDLNIKVRDDGVYILETENYRFHLDEKTHIEKIGKLINENEQLKSKNRGLQSELGIFKEDVTHSNQIINKLNDENEQLKKEIEELKWNLELER